MIKKTHRPRNIKTIQKSILFKYKEDRLSGNNGIAKIIKSKSPKLLHHSREIAWCLGRLGLIFS